MAAAVLITAPAAGCGKSAEEETLEAAFNKSKEIRSARQEFEAELSLAGLPGADGGEQPLRLRGAVDFDKSGDQPWAGGNIRLEGLSELATGMAAPGQDLGLGFLSQVGDMLQTFAAFDFVAVDDRVYLNLSGTWYEMTQSDMSMIGLDGAGLGGAMTGEGENRECYQKAMDDPERFSVANMLKDEQSLPDEAIDGVETRHYKASLDLKKLLDEVQQTMKDCGDAENAGALETARSDIEKLVKKADFEFWVDGDNNFRQVKVDADLDLTTFGDVAQAFGGGVGPVPEGSVQMGILATVKLSRFGETFDIKKPEGAKPFSDFIGNLIGLNLSGLGSSGLPLGTLTTPSTTNPSSSTTAAPQQ